MRRFASPDRLDSWLGRWGGIVPLLLAEFILWTRLRSPAAGDAALLHGAWGRHRPAGRGDRRVAGRAALHRATLRARCRSNGARSADGPRAGRRGRIGRRHGALDRAARVLLLRAVSGLGTALYDPAARGYLTDAAPEGRRGEVFGLYNAAQMGGILLGPAIGGLGTALLGGYVFVMVLCAVTTLWRRSRSRCASPSWRQRIGRCLHRDHSANSPPSATRRRAGPMRTARQTGRPAGARVGSRAPETPWPRRPAESLHRRRDPRQPRRLLRGGTVRDDLGALRDLARRRRRLVGLTFATFGLVTILFSPYGGRVVDRRGPFPFVISGLLIMAAMMGLYPAVSRAAPLPPDDCMVEAIGFAFLDPAHVRWSSPRVAGRSLVDGAGLAGPPARSGRSWLRSRRASSPDQPVTAVLCRHGRRRRPAGRDPRRRGPCAARDGAVVCQFGGRRPSS